MTAAPTIVWFRHDLRLDDNGALAAAAQAGPVIPVFIWAPGEEENWSPGAASRWWLAKSLSSLHAELQQLRSRLVTRSGSSATALLEIAAASGAKQVFWNRRYEPASVKRDERVQMSLEKAGIRCQQFNSSLLFDPAVILNQEGSPYRVFTPFWNRCLQLAPSAPVGAPRMLRAPRGWPASTALKNLFGEASRAAAFEEHWRPGAAQALKRFKHFANTEMENYIAGRDRPDLEQTSRLSPFLHFGEISPARIWTVAREHSRNSSAGVRRAAEAFLRQLIWREFACYILRHFPEMPERPAQGEFLKFPWRSNPRHLQAWQEGRTGYPLVDAGMRQLHETGWMHNRVRMIVASFLTKHLLISWQAGARWFWERLVDADLANNSFGWQWAAGCGYDAAPYFRIFNPVLQGEKFDPEGSYVRRWAPELEKLPAKWIHHPWDAPLFALNAAGVKLGGTYPKPIVDHARARERALSAYGFIRETKRQSQ